MSRGTRQRQQPRESYLIRGIRRPVNQIVPGLVLVPTALLNVAAAKISEMNTLMPFQLSGDCTLPGQPMIIVRSYLLLGGV